MTMWNYAISSLGWSLVGLLIGMFLGSAITVTRAAAQVIDDEGESMSEPTTTTGKATRSKPARRRPTAVQLLGVITALLGGLTLAQGYQQSQRTDETNSCLRAYADGFDAALEARTDASADAQQALDELITAFADAAAQASVQGRAQVAVALRTYQERRAEAKATQRDNPYPDPPRDLCKEA